MVKRLEGPSAAIAFETIQLVKRKKTKTTLLFLEKVFIGVFFPTCGFVANSKKVEIIRIYKFLILNPREWWFRTEQDLRLFTFIDRSAETC